MLSSPSQHALCTSFTQRLGRSAVGWFRGLTFHAQMYRDRRLRAGRGTRRGRYINSGSSDARTSRQFGTQVRNLRRTPKLRQVLFVYYCPALCQRTLHCEGLQNSSWNA
ncbi:hypothetical protein BDZ91DRAFT_548898 [Kalaharituber pfeilii]|nr:hypothetical protein BDZ91DRAFT_548898 [Kalaharituber pfeilii]